MSSAADRVVLTEHGEERSMSLEDFFDLPLSKRIRFLIDGAARFYAGSEQVDTGDALAHLRKIQAKT